MQSGLPQAWLLLCNLFRNCFHAYGQYEQTENIMKYGLIGKTLVHSYSKEIHEALGKYQYDLFSLPPEELSGFIAARDFGGLNITIPYKQDVMPLCDEVSELAAAIGAVNT